MTQETPTDLDPQLNPTGGGGLKINFTGPNIRPRLCCCQNTKSV